MNNYRMGTKCVQAGYTPGNGEPRQVPIIQSTTFKYSTSEDMGKLFDLEAEGYFYTRLQNPTNDHVAAKIAAMEGGTAAMLTSSGQAANFFAMFNICECGDHIVASSSIYGGTFNLIAVTLAKMGITATFVSPDASEEELEYMSLEKQVTEDMPPCFLWQTVTDELVPVQNSFLFAQALQEKKIPYAIHAFSKGKHGLSLADEAWANEEFGEPYTLEQTFALGQAVNDGTFPVPDEVKQALNEMAKMFTGQTKREKEQVNEEVKDWPELADEWIRTTL